MARTDIEQLRQFGQKVQTRNNELLEKKSKRTGQTELKVLIRKIKVVMKKYNTFKLRIKYSFIKIYVLLKKNFKKNDLQTSTFYYLDSPKRRKKDIGKRVVVEYQRQLGNTSIIIRRRKKILINKETDFPIMIPKSVAIEHSFSLTDSIENDQRTKFSPRSSIWDFHYQSKK